MTSGLESPCLQQTYHGERFRVNMQENAPRLAKPIVEWQTVVRLCQKSCLWCISVVFKVGKIYLARNYVEINPFSAILCTGNWISGYLPLTRNVKTNSRITLNFSFRNLVQSERLSPKTSRFSEKSLISQMTLIRQTNLTPFLSTCMFSLIFGKDFLMLEFYVRLFTSPLWLVYIIDQNNNHRTVIL